RLDKRIESRFMCGDVLDQTDVHRYRSKKPFAGYEELPGSGGANPSDDEGRNDRRQYSQLHFRKSELGSFDGDRYIARGSKSGAPAEGRAMNARDNRLWAFCNVGEHLRHSVGIFEIFLERVIDHSLHPVQVSTGTE